MDYRESQEAAVLIVVAWMGVAVEVRSGVRNMFGMARLCQECVRGKDNSWVSCVKAAGTGADGQVQP
jgi:hypothetical protein